MRTIDQDKFLTHEDKKAMRDYYTMMKMEFSKKKCDYIKSKGSASAAFDYIETSDIIRMQWLVSKVHDWEEGMDRLFFCMQKREFEDELNSRIHRARRDYERGSYARPLVKKTYKEKRQVNADRMGQLLGDLQETQSSLRTHDIQNVFTIDTALSLNRGRTHTNFNLDVHPGLPQLSDFFKRGEDINDNAEVYADLRRRPSNIDKYLRINKQGKPIGWSRATISNDQNNKHSHQLRHDIDQRIQPDYDTFQWTSDGFNATSSIDAYLMPRLMPDQEEL